jgi:transposase-like protein
VGHNIGFQVGRHRDVLTLPFQPNSDDTVDIGACRCGSIHHSRLSAAKVFSSAEPKDRQVTVIRRPTKTELAKAYRRLGSVPAVADEFGVAFETARRWLQDAGVPLNRKGRPSAAANDMPISEVKQRYRKGESIAQLGRAFDVSPATVRSRLIEAGVELRPRPGWKY